MDGIKRCEMFRAIRKRLCENNGIPFIEEECPNPDKKCIGTCPACDYWLNRINDYLALKRKSGEEINYSGIKEIYESYIISSRINSNSDSVAGVKTEERRSIEHVDGYFSPPERDLSHRILLEEIEREDPGRVKGKFTEDHWESREELYRPLQLEEERLKHEMERLAEERELRGKVVPDEREMGEIMPDVERKKELLEAMKDLSQTQNNGKKRCPICGQELPDDFRICPVCGQAL
ncbi:MAG: zinc ribbon domain-containing protein [Paludibacteraceae bacterium]|nr:zinc ribbon domain-containing protein [Paludibacteraceae bacterium]